MLIEKKYFQINELELDCQETLAEVTVVYETYGKLNDKQDNAILLLHALTGDAHAAGRHHPQDRKAGWYDRFIGSGKALDTDKYFIICSNVLGGCAGSTGPSSIDPRSGQAYALDFPFITIKDMVHAQYKLITEGLGLKGLYACVGGSFGGMQALEWSMNYPDFSKSYVLLACAPYQSAQNIALHEVGRRAIMNDLHWQGGKYYELQPPNDGLQVARMIAHISYLSDQSMHLKFGRRIRGKEELGFELHNEFEVESYLDYQGRSFIERFDANSYLYITRAVDYFDYSNGKLTSALTPGLAKYLVVSFSSDWLYPPYQTFEIVEALQSLNLSVSYCEVESPYGHDAFLLEMERLTPLLSDFLSHVSS